MHTFNGILSRIHNKIHNKIPTPSTEVAALFDAQRYLRVHSDVQAAQIDPLQHYLAHGAAEGRNPGASFLPNQIAKVPGGLAVAAYVEEHTNACKARVLGSPTLAAAFDDAAYLASNQGALSYPKLAAEHYTTQGLYHDATPPPGFLRQLKTEYTKGEPGAIKLYQAHLDALPKSTLRLLDPDPDLARDMLGVDAEIPIGLRVCAGIVLFNNDADEIEGLLHSIRRSRDVAAIDLRIVVINNGAPLDDAMTTVLRSYDVDLVPNADGNLGSSKGHTRLMKHTFETLQSDGYMTLNPDGVLHPFALSRMFKMCIRHDWTTAVEAAQVPHENSKYFDPDTYDTEWAVTACALFTRKIWDRLGGFDPNIFLYCDDVDYGFQIRRAGFTVKYCPWAYFFHDFADRTAVSQFYKQNSLEAGRYLGQKWANPAFRDACERELIEREFYDDTASMPNVDQFEPLPPPHDAANFDNKFYFARRRW